MTNLAERISALARPDSEAGPQLQVASVRMPLATARELVAEFLDSLNYKQNPATAQQIALCELREQFIADPLAVTRRIIKGGFFVSDIRIEAVE